jgi:hypothetical protein
MRLAGHGFMDYFDPRDDERWLCKYNASSNNNHSITTVCLADAEPVPEPPQSCDCELVESLQDRFLRSEQTGVSPGGTVMRFTASCPAEATLVGGSCILPFLMSGADRFVDLISVGFATDMDGNDVWECAWNNESSSTMNPSVVAICLRPPMPGTAPEVVPMADLVVKVEQRDTLPAGTSFIHQATCAEGDLLLRGGCTLEEPEAAPLDLSIFRAGFLREEDDDEDTLPNTWQCGWNNPSTSTPTAIATALCIKPVPAP